MSDVLYISTFELKSTQEDFHTIEKKNDESSKEYTQQNVKL